MAFRPLTQETGTPQRACPTENVTKTDYLRQTHHEFLEASEEALANPTLQRVLGQLSDTLGRRNREAWAALPTSDLIRERGFACKAEILAKLASMRVRIVEEPVALDWSRREGESKMPVGKTMLAYWRMLFRQRGATAPAQEPAS